VAKTFAVGGDVCDFAAVEYRFGSVVAHACK
jgi:hypothetical protein